jgi:zinc transporter 1
VVRGELASSEGNLQTMDVSCFTVSLLLACLTPPSQRTAAHREHRHETTQEIEAGTARDLGMMGVLLHVMGDAANNIGVIRKAD